MSSFFLQSEEDWISKERYRLKVIEKDVRQEVNKARYQKEVKLKRDRKVRHCHVIDNNSLFTVNHSIPVL